MTRTAKKKAYPAIANHNPYFPFYALGFRCNPFRAVTDEEWVELAVLPEEVEVALARSGHLQILGEKGHGKTTALLALAAQFKREGQRVVYEHLEMGQSHFRTDINSVDVLLLDEADRLNRSERRRLLAGLNLGRRVMLGSHADLASLFTRRGLPLTTVRFDTPPLAQLEAVLRRRLAYFALDPASPGVWLSPESVRYAHRTFGGDLRAIEQVLYEVFQGLKQPGQVGVDEVKKVVEAAAPSPRSTTSGPG